MAAACKCDRCGQFFEVGNRGVNRVKFMNRPVLYTGDFPDMPGDKIYDLCNSCYNLLIDWFKMDNNTNKEE